MNSYKETDRIIYKLGVAAAVLALVVFAIIEITGFDIYTIMPPCYLYTIFHVYCPGCGGSRALMWLLHGNIIKSFIYHPIIIYGVILYLLFMVSQTLSLFSKNKIKGIHMRPAYIIAAGVIIIINWIVRNILLLKYNILI